MRQSSESTGSGNIRFKDITVCPECDLVVALAPLDVPLDSQLICPRCKCRLRIPQKNSVNRTLALSLAGLLLFAPAHFMFLLQLEALGIFDRGTVYDSIVALYQQKYFLVALAVLCTAILIPLAKLLLLFIVSLCLSLRVRLRPLAFLFRSYCHIEEWGMTEIFLIGILITVVKMNPTAAISYETGFFAFAGLTLLLVCSVCTLDRHDYWERIEKLQNREPPTRGPRPLPDLSVRPGEQAIDCGIVQCRTCHKIFPAEPPDPGHISTCSRCGSTVHARTPDSIGATWALVISAFIFFFPANQLPIMQVDFLGSPQKSTIMDGITYFFETGSIGIGLVIFTASILVPVFKVVGLALLLYSIHFNRWSRLAEKSIMFRFIKFIGRWSMLDIFVIALLCSLVDFGFFTRINIAPAATPFMFVVLTTMFAAISFDPRLLWDKAYRQNRKGYA